MGFDGDESQRTKKKKLADDSCCVCLGWAKFMEWKYPVNVVMTSSKMFKAAGAVEAAASL